MSRAPGFLLAGLFAASTLGAQAPTASPPSSPTRVIAGEVTRPTGNGRSAPVSGAWVVLHRVGPDAAAPIDSMRLRGDGRYRFQYRATGDSTAVYFVSTMRGGVAYFTPPTREATLQGGTANLQVFDTTSAPLPIRVRGRHLIVTAPASATEGTRSVIEVYELSNDTTLTRVAGGDGTATFEGPLPAGVTAVRGGQGDISPDAIRVEEGRVRVFAPLAPGVKQFSFSYEIPATAATLAVHVETDIPVMEVLVEDPRGSATGGELAEVDPVQVEGRPFKRFLGESMVPPLVVEVTMPGATETVRGLRVMLVVTAIGAAMLLGLGMSFLRGGPRAFARRRAVTPEALALEIAALDAAFEALGTPSEQQKAEHYLRRAQLKGRLRAALAKRDGLV